MSFSTDLDAVRERAGLPVIQRWRCLTCDERLIITRAKVRARFSYAEAWARLHSSKGHVYELTEGPGRFQVRRLYSVTVITAEWPWVIRDAERPRTYGWARTHAAAIELVGVMHSRPGRAAQVVDEDDEVVAYVAGSGAPYVYDDGQRWLNA